MYIVYMSEHQAKDASRKMKLFHEKWWNKTWKNYTSLINFYAIFCVIEFSRNEIIHLGSSHYGKNKYKYFRPIVMLGITKARNFTSL